jgi:hypothetical protein
VVNAIRPVGLKDREGRLSLNLLAGKSGFGKELAQDTLTTCLEGFTRFWGHNEGIIASLDQKP